MTSRQARQILLLRRWDGADDEEPDFKHALTVRDHDPVLAAECAAWQSLDVEVAAEFHSLEADDADILQAVEVLRAKARGMRVSARNPAVLAVALGFLLLVAVLTWHFLGQAGVFPDEAIKIAQMGASASPDSFEDTDSKAAQLQDWFMLKGFDDFQVPPGLENYQVVGVRLFRYENEQIAQALVPDHTMFFYAFPATQLGVEVEPEKSWRVTEVDNWVIAIREEKEVCFMIAFRGKKPEMEKILATLPRG